MQMDYAHLDRPLELLLRRQLSDLDGLRQFDPNCVRGFESTYGLACEFEFVELNLYVNQWLVRDVHRDNLNK